MGTKIIPLFISEPKNNSLIPGLFSDKNADV
jgi:hypothetical protein